MSSVKIPAGTEKYICVQRSLFNKLCLVKPHIKTGLLFLVLLLGMCLVCITTFNIWTNRGGKPAGASFSIGKTETSSSLSSGCTTSASENATFSSRRVLLAIENPNPLSRRIAAVLAQKLKDSPQIQELAATFSSPMLIEGSKGPDLFIGLELVDLKTDGILAIAGSIKATVAASLGNTPWQSSNHYSDATSPPLVEFAWNATLEANSTFDGIRSDRYADTVNSIADKLAEAISKKTEELGAKYPKLPELPTAFYGPYQPVMDFDFLRSVQARRVASYHGLLTHNETFWRFRTAANPVPCLQQIISALEADGWKCSDLRLTNTESYFIRAQQGAKELEIFNKREDLMNWQPTSQRSNELKFIVHYQQRFSGAEREAALETLFVGSRSIETLLPFRNSFSKSQRDKFYALMEKSPAASPAACVQLAEAYLYRKQTNAAVNLLLRAKALEVTVRDATSLNSSIEAAAKQISPKKTFKLDVTPEICRDLGFLEITNLPPTIEQTRVLGQALVFFGPSKRGVEIIALTVQPPQQGAYPWFRVRIEDSGRSSSWSTFTPTANGDWQYSFTYDQQTIKIVAVPLPDQNEVKYSIRVEPPE